MGTAPSETIEVVNLSRGILCPHIQSKHPYYPIGNYRFSRIQSTHCERNLWDKMVSSSFGPDLWMHLASGHHLIVHDYSEKPWKWDESKQRETRACWQGAALIRYCAERIWGMPITPAIGGRTAPFDMTDYFEAVFESTNDKGEGISNRTKSMIKYYKNFRNQLGKVPPVRLTSCWREENDAIQRDTAGWPVASR